MNCIRIYESWEHETEPLTLEEKGRLIDCLVEYARTGEEKLPEGNERFVYPLMIERIRRENDTHERRKAERREAKNT